MKLVLLALASLAIGCTNDTAKVNKLLHREGYTNVDVGGPAILGGCGEDYFSNHFTATKNGQHVRGYVCGGYFKGMTIRLID